VALGFAQWRGSKEWNKVYCCLVRDGFQAKARDPAWN
jgi:hypothetical protein